MSARVDELTQRPACRSCRRRSSARRSRRSARPGDRAIILADGSIEGFVGGHCAAGSVRTAALGALGSGESLLLRVLPDGDDAFPESPGASVVVNPCLSGGALEIYLEPLLPPADAARRRAPRRPPTRWRDWPRARLRRRPRRRRRARRRHRGRGRQPRRRRGGRGPGARSTPGVGFVGVVCSRTRGAALLAELALVRRGGRARAPPRRTRHRRPHRRRRWALSILAAMVRSHPGRRPVRVRRCR